MRSRPGAARRYGWYASSFNAVAIGQWPFGRAPARYGLEDRRSRWSCVPTAPLGHGSRSRVPPAGAIRCGAARVPVELPGLGGGVYRCAAESLRAGPGPREPGPGGRPPTGARSCSSGDGLSSSGPRSWPGARTRLAEQKVGRSFIDRLPSSSVLGRPTPSTDHIQEPSDGVDRDAGEWLGPCFFPGTNRISSSARSGDFDPSPFA